MDLPPAQQAVTDLCAALGIEVPDTTYRVQIEAGNDGVVNVVIAQLVYDRGDLSHIRKRYEVQSRRTLSLEEGES